MATSAAIPSPNTLAEMPVKTESLNYAVIAKGDPNAAKSDVKYSLTTSQNEIDTIEKPDYNGDKAIVTKCTVSKPIVGTMEGLDQLFPNDKDKIFIINKGIDAHFNARVRANLLETNDANDLTYPFTDGVIDGTPFVQEIVQRAKPSAEETLIASLSKMGVTQDMVANILAQIRNQSGAQVQAQAGQ